MLRVYTHGRNASMLEVWFDDSDAVDADDRHTTVLNVNSEGTYWNRLHTKELVFHPCALDTQSFMDCLHSIGDERPDVDVQSEARALAAAAAQMFATGVLPDSIDGFAQISRQDQGLASTIPAWFNWAVGAFWIMVGTVGSIMVTARPRR